MLYKVTTSLRSSGGCNGGVVGYVRVFNAGMYQIENSDGIWPSRFVWKEVFILCAVFDGEELAEVFPLTCAMFEEHGNLAALLHQGIGITDYVRKVSDVNFVRGTGIQCGVKATAQDSAVTVRKITLKVSAAYSFTNLFS